MSLTLTIIYEPLKFFDKLKIPFLVVVVMVLLA